MIYYNHIKINFDAAFDQNTNVSSIGLIIRNAAGEMQRRRHCPGSSLDAEQAKGKAALKAILWAARKEITNLHLEGDNLNIVNAIRHFTFYQVDK